MMTRMCVAHLPFYRGLIARQIPAVAKTGRALEESTGENIRLQKAQSGPTRDPTDQWLERLVSRRGHAGKNLAPANRRLPPHFGFLRRVTIVPFKPFPPALAHHEVQIRLADVIQCAVDLPFLLTVTEIDECRAPTPQ